MDGTPRLRVESACERRGRSEVVRGCVEVLEGDLRDEELIIVLGGEHARDLLRREVPMEQAHWLRVWALRGLLWAGPDGDLAPLRAASRDGCWRVREMACKVVARHRLDDLLDECVGLSSDDVSRVRIAAERAVVRIVTAPDGPGTVAPPGVRSSARRA